jgi:ureidoacrylate peracid hydrolase
MKLRSLAEKLDPQWSCLLVIDMQNDYCDPGGTLAQVGQRVDQIAEMLPRLQRLIAVAREAGIPIWFTRNWHSDSTDSESWAEWLEHMWPPNIQRPGRAGTWGAEFWGVEPASQDQVLDKFRYDAFQYTNLELKLRVRGIRTVICAGVGTEGCVAATAFGASMRGFYLVLAEDCCGSTDRDLHAATMTLAGRLYGVVAPLEEIEAGIREATSLNTFANVAT